MLPDTRMTFVALAKAPADMRSDELRSKAGRGSKP